MNMKKIVIFVFFTFICLIEVVSQCDTLRWKCVEIGYINPATGNYDTLNQKVIDPIQNPSIVFYTKCKNVSEYVYHKGDQIYIKTYILPFSVDSCLGHAFLMSYKPLKDSITPLNCFMDSMTEMNWKTSILDPIENYYGQSWYNIISYCKVMCVIVKTNTDGFFTDSICLASADTAIITFRYPNKIVENSQNQFSYYPNPTSRNLTIFNGDFLINDISVYNVMGKKIKQFFINSVYADLDVSMLSSGMYILKVNTENGILTRKLQIISN